MYSLKGRLVVYDVVYDVEENLTALVPFFGHMEEYTCSTIP